MLDDMQIIGAWQPAEDGDIKAVENGDKAGIVAIKVMPMQYETPTIPDATIEVAVSLVMRADSDSTGQYYIDVTSTLQDTLHAWQKSFNSFHDDFTIAGFEPTGFRLDGGDCGLDRENCTWTFTQQFTLNGIVA